MTVSEAQLKATERYRDKFVQVAVLLPREIEPLVREVSGGRKAGYIRELIYKDLRERGLMRDSE